MAKIDDLDNLITEFEQAAKTISQLKLLVSSAENLKSKLEKMLVDLQSKTNDLHAVADIYRNEISDTDGIKTELRQQIGDAQTFVSNSSKTLVGLKNEVASVLQKVAASAARADNTADQLTTKFAILQESVANKFDNAFGEHESKNFQLRQELSDSANQAIASLPGEFTKHKQELEQKVQAALSGALHEFMGRQTTLVSNLNQRNDALQSLVDTQRIAMSGQLDAAVLRIEKLEGAISKRTGIFGLFK